ncbi:4-methylaminobutanoate oxidase (formaldehyde-forming) [Pedococcus dokdonensis]|uniref:4-methylaminobutanoate oxidase (Formaldehyde-forming) n=1 Tax=Pedococcus dokdonensis TaxID=443156 RepID=A0A1H0LL24_9MICO|nr:FAD-dependent oxidoreductase [Pedococcus dokdonensis]SDO68854.1 4-methylaminobutanoate oxidase (formaldehyde-forming) [Pedococcus dokdonensis]
MTTVPGRARVVVIGGGVIGCSVAYHLTRLGWTDVVVLEQGTLSCGTTWHAAGLVGQLRASEAGTRLVQYSTDLYARLEDETGLTTGYRVCGGLTVARTPERMVQLRRTVASAAAYDLECELLTPQQAQDRYPLIQVDDVVGAIWLPGDGRANPTDLTQSLAKGARMGGATILERVRVTGVRSHRGRVAGVTTDLGDIEAEVVVNCAGQWAKAVGALAGVTVPLHSAEHFYVVTDQVAGVHRDLPILRDPDGYTYVKEEVGGLLVGGFEPVAKPWVSPDRIPYPFEFALLDEDWEHFEILMDSAVHRIPVLAETGIRKFYNGPESFTPDNQFLLGEAPELPGFFVGAGFNSVGIASAGGAGRALAEWVVEGEPTSDLIGVDLRRFSPLAGSNAWLRARVGEVLGLHYAVPWPNRELESARPQRLSPVHDLLVEQGACLGSRNAWERANVFAPAGVEPVLDYSWERPRWVDWCVAEQRATREAVAVFDQTSFSKYVVTGPDSLRALQWLCSADVDVPVGRAVYTALLNSRGTYEADLTVTRTSATDFFLVSSAATTVRDLDWIRRHVPEDARLGVVDVTGSYAVFGVMGPRSRELLEALGDDRFDDASFRFGTSREVVLGEVLVRATRITYVGELGWELYVPTELARSVYLDLFRAGADLGVVPAGYYAIEAMRLEKGYRAFARELTTDTGPVAAGLTFACKLRGDVDFLGRSAVEATRGTPPARRVVSFVVGDPAAYLWGGELVLRDGVPAGQVTSAAWGATVGSAVGLALVGDRDGGTADKDWLDSGEWEVDLAGQRFAVDVSLRPPFDPGGRKLGRETS